MNTRVGIFGRAQRPEIKSLGDGVAAYGDRPIFQHPDAWKECQAKPDEFDLVVVHGFSGPGQGIADYYRRHDIPVFVIEQGHIRRGEYHQLGCERLNWLPDKADSKRRKALGIEKTERAEYFCPIDIVLILGQKPGDAQHEGVDVDEYLNEQMRKVYKTGLHILYRPHPKDNRARTPIRVPCVIASSKVDLYPELARAHSVVTFNSNSGLKAILKGVPTFCDPRAIYAGACKTDASKIESEYNIPRAKWEDTLNRICYAQWNLDELASGEGWQFIREQSKVSR